jgi:GNAT superfamily N-acetyltransferase
MPWAHGRHLLTLDLMALRPDDFAPVAIPPEITVRAAKPADLDTVVAIDAAAFEEDADADRPWIAPHLEADEITTALASLDGEPAGTGYTIRTDGRGGPALYLAGVGVHPDARRRGVAAALSSWLVERGLGTGARLVHLHADTEDAARVYARLGFTRAPGLDVYVDL